MKKKRVYPSFTNVVKTKDIIFSLDRSSSFPKVVGVSKDGEFRSFAYIPVGGSLEQAKRSIHTDYKNKYGVKS